MDRLTLIRERAAARQRRRVVTCSRCRGTGHNARGCRAAAELGTAHTERELDRVGPAPTGSFIDPPLDEELDFG